MTRVAEVRGSNRVQRAVLLTALSGVLYALPHPPFSVHAVAWVALIPFLAALRMVSPAAAAGCGVLWSFVATVGVAWWIPKGVSAFFTVGPGLGVLALVAVCVTTAVFVAPFASWVAWMSRRGPINPLLAGAAWGVVEYGRTTLLANPYYLLGYSQNGTPFIQIADIAGIFGVSMLVMAVNAALAGLLAGRRQWADASVAVLFVAAWIYGGVRLSQTYGTGTPIRVAVIQGGLSYPAVPNQERRAIVMEKYRSLASVVTPKHLDLVVMPEHAADADLEIDAVLRTQFSAGRETLAGGIHFESPRMYNSAFLIEGGKTTARYDKHALMPFAEDDKLKRMGVRRGAFTRGKLEPITSRAARIGVVICSEGMGPSVARQLTAKGAELFVNPSSDEWLQYPFAARAQFESSVVRAIENRRYMLRPVTTGYSAIIDPAGRSIAESRFGGEAILYGDVHRMSQRTLYSRWGDAPIAVMLLMVTAASVVRILPVSRTRRVSMFRFIVILALASAPALQAADLVVMPAEVAAKAQTLLPLVPATVQPKVLYAARSLAGPIVEGTLTEQSANPAVLAAFGPTTDIHALAAIVMMQAAKDAEADLKQMMDEIRKLNEQKDATRRYVSTLKAQRAAMSKALAAQYDSRAELPSMFKTPFLQLEYARYQPDKPIDPSSLTVEQLDALIAGLEKKMDAMNEMNETIALRLQMAMDRMSKFMATLSNVLKQISDTASTIVANLK